MHIIFFSKVPSPLFCFNSLIFFNARSNELWNDLCQLMDRMRKMCACLHLLSNPQILHLLAIPAQLLPKDPYALSLISKCIGSMKKLHFAPSDSNRTPYNTHAVDKNTKSSILSEEFLMSSSIPACLPSMVPPQTIAHIAPATKILFEKKMHVSIIAVTTELDEYIELKQEVRIRGSVEVWLSELIKTIASTIRQSVSQLMKSFAKDLVGGYTSIILQYPLQSLSLVRTIQWSTRVEEIFKPLAFSVEMREAEADYQIIKDSLSQWLQDYQDIVHSSIFAMQHHYDEEINLPNESGLTILNFASKSELDVGDYVESLVREESSKNKTPKRHMGLSRTFRHSTTVSRIKSASSKNSSQFDPHSVFSNAFSERKSTEVSLDIDVQLDTDFDADSDHEHSDFVSPLKSTQKAEHSAFRPPSFSRSVNIMDNQAHHHHHNFRGTKLEWYKREHLLLEDMNRLSALRDLCEMVNRDDIANATLHWEYSLRAKWVSGEVGCEFYHGDLSLPYGWHLMPSPPRLMLPLSTMSAIFSIIQAVKFGTATMLSGPSNNANHEILTALSYTLGRRFIVIDVVSEKIEWPILDNWVASVVHGGLWGYIRGLDYLSVNTLSLLTQRLLDIKIAVQ